VTLHACTIANFCLIGMGSIVLDAVWVDEFVLIGAGSVVTRAAACKKTVCTWVIRRAASAL